MVTETKFKYTNEIIADITTKYNSGVTVDDIAASYEVPPRSVIAKLSSLGVYKKKTYVNKLGQAPVKKEEYVTQIADILGMHYDVCESLEKVTKVVLQALVKKLKETPAEVQED